MQGEPGTEWREPGSERGPWAHGPSPAQAGVPASRQHRSRSVPPARAPNHGPSDQTACRAEAGGRAVRRRPESGEAGGGRPGAALPVCLSSGREAAAPQVRPVCGRARLTRTAEGAHVPAPGADRPSRTQVRSGARGGGGESSPGERPGLPGLQLPRMPSLGLPPTKRAAPGAPPQVDPDSRGPEFRVHTRKPQEPPVTIAQRPNPMPGPVMRAWHRASSGGKGGGTKNLSVPLCPKPPQRLCPSPRPAALTSPRPEPARTALLSGKRGAHPRPWSGL